MIIDVIAAAAASDDDDDVDGEDSIDNWCDKGGVVGDGCDYVCDDFNYEDGRHDA